MKIKIYPVVIQQQPHEYQHHNHGLSVTVHVKIKHVTIVTPKAASAYHTSKPINLAGLRAREELERTDMQDAVWCCGVAG